jgi:hypothetical protein
LCGRVVRFLDDGAVQIEAPGGSDLVLEPAARPPLARQLSTIGGELPWAFGRLPGGDDEPLRHWSDGGRLGVIEDLG